MPALARGLAPRRAAPRAVERAARLASPPRPRRRAARAAAGPGAGAGAGGAAPSGAPAQEGPSADLGVIAARLRALAGPFWTEGDQSSAARWRLAGVLGLTLGTTGVSVLFNFLGRDFFNALAAKDEAKFAEMLGKWAAALAGGIPVFVARDYFQARLALEWRAWMTADLTGRYFGGRAFYRVQAGALLDNPDQRIAVDVRNFTDTSLGLAVTALTAAVDLASFSGILYSIYPPLFGALALYSVGGTAASLYIGRPLVGLNFAQEAAEANFRYGLVRVRENAESIAFYGGEGAEAALLGSRLKAAVDNYLQLLAASRNLSFFTSFYRFAIGILPAAVVAPLFFRGEIEFGVVNQSSSAFNHILSDVSLIVFQLESLAGFSAVVDRLGQMSEVLDACGEGGPGGEVCALPAEAPASGGGAAAASLGDGGIEWRAAAGGLPGGALLAIKDLSLRVPATGASLVEALTLSVGPRERLLVMGPSGAGKTSLLRAAAGLWRAGAGAVSLGGAPVGVAGGAGGGAAGGGVFFVPQRPYVVLGTLRDQLLYPAWSPTAVAESGSSDGDGTAAAYGADSSSSNGAAARPPPDDAALCAALRAAALGPLLDRLGGDLDAAADWAGALSLGEQQRLALARVLLARPALALLDESTSALDGANEARLYAALADAGVAVVSVGHRPSLLRLHDRALILRGGGAWELAAAADVPLEAAVELAD